MKQIYHYKKIYILKLIIKINLINSSLKYNIICGTYIGGILDIHTSLLN